MKTVAYSNPFVPPEWIAAHRLWPEWIRPRSSGQGKGDRSNSCEAPFGPFRQIGPVPFSLPVQGMCPYARALLCTVLSDTRISALVMTTTCDQMRHAAGLLARRSDLPVFLMNVPRTWQTAVAGQLYLDELKRLGRFLVQLGGSSPSSGHLAQVMLEHESARERQAKHVSLGDTATEDAIPLAIVGGPVMQQHGTIFDMIERAGGRVVLDATEGGQRTMPAKFERRRLGEDPLRELASAYFGSIPDPLRRPNDGFYRWLADTLAARRARGLLLWRYVWCDTWHAELHRLKQTAGVPVLDVDAGDEEDGSLGRTVGRIEAFLEMLQ